jgi:integrase/recombinase XerC
MSTASNEKLGSLGTNWSLTSLKAASGCLAKTYTNWAPESGGESSTKIEGEKLGELGTSWSLPSSRASDPSPATTYANWALELGGDTDSEKLLAEFLAYEQARGARPRHLKELGPRVRKFLGWMDGEALAVSEIDLAAARGYQRYLLAERTAKDEPYAVNTVLSYRTCAASFCRFLHETRRIESNPFRAVRAPRSEKKVLEGVLKESEMATLLEKLARWDEAGSHLKHQARRYMAHVIGELQYASGLRIAEVAALREEDIDFEKQLLIVREGKHGRSRVAYLSEYACAVLKLFLERLRPLILGGHYRKHDDLVFGSETDYLGHMQNKHLAQATSSLGLKVTSHGFRHALGYHLLRSGCALRQIQEILGHERIKDTERYTKVDVQAVQAVLDECHPRGKRSLGHA